MDPAAKRIVQLRFLVVVMLVVTTVIVGVGSYLGASYVESSSAKYRFTTTVEAAVSKLDENFRNMDGAVRLLAHNYVDKNPTLADWPTAVLPHFHNRARLVRDITIADTIAFGPLVKPEDLSRYEAFIFDYWDNDTNIPPGKAGYYSAQGDRGVWAVNDTSNGLLRSTTAPYHDTTGRTTWGENRRIIPATQMLFTDLLPPSALGFNTYAAGKQGEATDRMVRCVEDSSFQEAIDKCSATTQMSTNSVSQDYLVKTDAALTCVNSYRLVPVVVGNSSQHEFVGHVGAQYSFGPTLSRIFASAVSGIDIVVKYRGFTFTCRIKEGLAEIVGGSAVAGYGDVASKRYAEHKVHVVNTLQRSQLQIETDEQYNLEMTFYPTEEFVSHYLTYLPIVVACSEVLLILLVSLVFVGYDMAVRGQLVSNEILLDTVKGEAARKEIVLDTKRRFVRFVSHEIRTPMNAVRLGMTLFSTEIDGFVAKLAGKSLEEVMGVLQTTATDWKQIAVDVLDNSEAAVDVLNDLLNYDKIETGSLKLEFSMVPVWRVLQRTFKTFVLQAREKEIVFQLQGEMFGADASLLVGDLENLHCLGDETRITQVLRNLMSNSLKFTQEKGAVTVLAEYLPDGLPNAVIPPAPNLLLANPRAGAVRITVVDDGAGLSPDQVGDICKEGVQFNANTLQAGGGSGLGLFIGKGIVEQHGGTMQVSSEGLGKGATFMIELPLFEVQGLPVLQDPLSGSLSRSSNRARSLSMGILEEDSADEREDEVGSLQVPVTKHLLVVDDASSNRKLLVRILTLKGYVCREAADGQQALDVYQQMCADDCAPCAVLMDFEMPVMNGPTATKQLRELGCDSYIVGVTGNVMVADVDVFIDHGADSVLAKPLRVEQFESMIASLDNKSKPGTPRRHSSRPAGLALTLSNPEAAPQHSSNQKPAVSPTSVLFKLSPRSVKIRADPAQQCDTPVCQDASISSLAVSVLDNTHNV